MRTGINSSVRLSDKTEFFALDYFRLVFAVAVVSIHIPPFADVNNVLNYYLQQVLPHLAVPFFFLASGFFLHRKLNDFKKVKAYLLRLFALYLTYTVLYLPLIVYGYIEEKYTLIRSVLWFLRNFIFVGSVFHLWYFVALMAAALLLYLFVRKLKLRDKHIVAIVLALYVIGTVMYTYIQPLRKSIDVPVSELATLDKQYLLLYLYSKVFNTTRNGLFFGLPCLFFGYLIAKNKERIRRKNYLVLSIVSLIVMTGEVFIAHEIFGASDVSMLFTLLPASIFVFLFVLFIDCGNSQRNAQIAKHARKISVLYYGLHPLINFCIGGVLHRVFDIELHSLLRFIVVIILNFAAAEVIIRMSDVKHFKWLKNLY